MLLAGIALWVSTAAQEREASNDNAPAGHTMLRVATLNIHYLDMREASVGNDRPDVTRWELRDRAVVAVLREADADIAAFQEMETFAGGHANRKNVQQATLEEAFLEYAFSATGDPEVFPNTQPVMFRRHRFVPEGQGFFFYSPQPDEIYSSPWYGRYPAFATWVRLRDRRDGRFYLVVNVHIDRERYRNKILSAELTADRIADIRRPDDTVIVLGDFNSFRWSRVVRIVADGAGLEVAPGDGGTFHFYRGLHFFPAIDHVLFQGNSQQADPAGLTHQETRAIRSRPDGVWPSDHYPVVVDFAVTSEY